MIRARVFLTLVFFTSAQPAAACHRFHIWRYPFPQRCEVHLPRTAHHRAPLLRSASRPARTASLPMVMPARPAAPRLPLPALSFVEIIGGEAGEATRARLLLHHVVGANR